MTAYQMGERAAEKGQSGIPPMSIRTDAECEAWMEGYYAVRCRMLAEQAFSMARLQKESMEC